jgi:spermidine synthase
VSFFFLLFFVSGFCSILYEIVWLRLSMAQFGVTSALVSIVLSMFMAGLGLGSWGSGRLLRNYGDRASSLGLRLYALAELLIGISALLVPIQLRWGRTMLERAGFASSGAYYLLSGIWIALTLIPWCACMGSTIPLAMAAIKGRFRAESPSSFSYLYVANVVGAAAGTIIPLLLIELYGFHGTLKVGAALNGLLAISAGALALQPFVANAQSLAPAVSSRIRSLSSKRPLALLFATGLTSMGMEIVWIRQFTPYLGTMVYAFAAILALYLISTLIGSKIYRRWSKTNSTERGLVWLGLGFCAFLPLAAADPQFRIFTALRPIIGIAPFSAILGFITPMLVDQWSDGDPDRAGSAYAMNVLGCILGPLLSGFLLLPLMSERWVICLFAVPWLAVGLNPAWISEPAKTQPQSKVAYAVGALALVLVFVCKDYESQFPHHQVLRDNAATIIATGEGAGRQLLVNGVGITSLSPIPKLMAHMPLAHLDHPPQNALTICFGMGTTYRSLLSWGIPVTAVELVPSVPRMFWYYHADGPQLLRSPLSRVVIDDGRRYLERTSEQYDVITLDPPPPVEAAGSSMLYSKEFYAIVNQRLQPHGILQQWLPEGDPAVRSAVARALKESFPYVRVFQYSPNWGFQFLASQQPIPNRTGAELLGKMPATAVRDLFEWPYSQTPEMELNYVLEREKPLDELTAGDVNAPAMQDDNPVNEYLIIRTLIRNNFQVAALSAWYEHTKRP